MSTRDVLLRELLQLTSTHKEGFKSGTPESQRINTLIDELAPLSRYPDALNHPEIFRGHWAADYHSIGRLVGGKDAQDEGVGVTVSLKVFSMGRLPDIPSTFLGNGLEIDPETGDYNFVAQFLLGEKRVPSFHFSFAKYRRSEESLKRFFVDFCGFKVVPADSAMSMDEFAREIGVADASLLSAELNPRTKLWSDVAYMDDEIRIQLGQLGGHYVMARTDRPMYSIEYWKDKSVVPPTDVFASA
jgi:hypothetical protein